MSPNKTIDIVKEYADKVKDSGIKLESVYLFGSYAKNKQNKWSDIDICIVSPDFGKNRFKERLFLMNIANNINDAIEPHPYTSKELKNKYDPLAREILKTGKKISKK